MEKVDLLTELAGAALDGVRSMTMAAEEGLKSSTDELHDRIASLTNKLPTEVGSLLGEVLAEIVLLARIIGWDAEVEGTEGFEKAYAAVHAAVSSRSETTDCPEWRILADRLNKVFMQVQNIRVDVAHLRDLN